MLSRRWAKVSGCESSLHLLSSGSWVYVNFSAAHHRKQFPPPKPWQSRLNFPNFFDSNKLF